MKASIRGKQWTIIRTRVGAGLLGDCNIEHRRIRISPSLSGEEELEIILHELTHGALWDLDETVVSEIGKDFSSILWKMGYRKTKP